MLQRIVKFFALKKRLEALEIKLASLEDNELIEADEIRQIPTKSVGQRVTNTTTSAIEDMNIVVEDIKENVSQVIEDVLAIPEKAKNEIAKSKEVIVRVVTEAKENIEDVITRVVDVATQAKEEVTETITEASNSLVEETIETITEVNEIVKEKTAETISEVNEIVQEKTAETVNEVNEIAEKTTENLNKDDLTVIKGIGGVMETKLNLAGFYTYEQLSKVSLVSEIFQDFKGNAERYDWISQAQELAK